MRHGRMIFILGDVHGEFEMLNQFINKAIRNSGELRSMATWWKESGEDFRLILLQCGDFAWF